MILFILLFFLYYSQNAISWLRDAHFSMLQLEMERALLEGEHQTEMERLQEDQEKIRHLRHKQNMLMEKATREREKVW